jgi:hypothetical protein
MIFIQEFGCNMFFCIQTIYYKITFIDTVIFKDIKFTPIVFIITDIF